MHSFTRFFTIPSLDLLLARAKRATTQKFSQVSSAVISYSESSSEWTFEKFLQHVAVCCSVLRCVAVCCGVLQCVAVYGCVLQSVAVHRLLRSFTWVLSRLPGANCRDSRAAHVGNPPNFDAHLPAPLFLLLWDPPRLPAQFLRYIHRRRYIYSHTTCYMCVYTCIYMCITYSSFCSSVLALRPTPSFLHSLLDTYTDANILQQSTWCIYTYVHIYMYNILVFLHFYSCDFEIHPVFTHNFLRGGFG